jgi:hypothetical protein
MKRAESKRSKGGSGVGSGSGGGANGKVGRSVRGLLGGG